MANPCTSIDERLSTVARMFSSIAPGYDRANRWMTLGLDRRWRRQSVAGLLPYGLGAGQRVLDLCAGTLESTLEIYRQYPEAEIVALDFSQQMLEIGVKKLDPQTLRRVTVKTAAAEYTGEPDGSFNAIFCAFSLRNVGDLSRVTREQARCLKPGGRLTILEFFRPASPMITAFISVYGGVMFPLIGGLTSGEPNAYRYLRRSIEGFLTVPLYCNLIAQRGFSDIRVQTLAPGIASVVRATRTY
jgi:demethylmenaquinone methyltransferase/2-methoxy-6-polyprenyl-1,4-benzoquinol methylase